VLVVDANVAVLACSGPRGFDVLAGQDLVAPPLLWSEFLSSIHQGRWRDEVSAVQADKILKRFSEFPVERRMPRRLWTRAWEIAEQLGWAKTYDAEYVALADLLGCRVVTLDRRMRRGAARLGFVIGPDEL
jgi:predicted nucleic acid-binding protein